MESTVTIKHTAGNTILVCMVVSEGTVKHRTGRAITVSIATIKYLCENLYPLRKL